MVALSARTSSSSAVARATTSKAMASASDWPTSQATPRARRRDAGDGWMPGSFDELGASLKGTQSSFKGVWGLM